MKKLQQKGEIMSNIKDTRGRRLRVRSKIALHTHRQASPCSANCWPTATEMMRCCDVQEVNLVTTGLTMFFVQTLRRSYSKTDLNQTTRT
jgi:hypothetical protein